jgi:uncharacterized protein YcbK (DUF882 family)
MIKYNDLLSGNMIADVDIKTQHNLEELLGRLKLVEVASGITFICTSGLRTFQHHKEIYSKLNAQRRAKGLAELKVPMGSKHLYGQAADISDPDGRLMVWCKANEDLLSKFSLWCEEKDDQPRVHFQTVPPASGHRFFKP